MKRFFELTATMHAGSNPQDAAGIPGAQYSLDGRNIMLSGKIPCTNSVTTLEGNHLLDHLLKDFGSEEFIKRMDQESFTVIAHILEEIDARMGEIEREHIRGSLETYGNLPELHKTLLTILAQRGIDEVRLEIYRAVEKALKEEAERIPDAQSIDLETQQLTDFIAEIVRRVNRQMKIEDQIRKTAKTKDGTVLKDEDIIERIETLEEALGQMGMKIELSKKHIPDLKMIEGLVESRKVPMWKLYDKKSRTLWTQQLYFRRLIDDFKRFLKEWKTKEASKGVTIEELEQALENPDIVRDCAQKVEAVLAIAAAENHTGNERKIHEAAVRFPAGTLLNRYRGQRSELKKNYGVIPYE